MLKSGNSPVKRSCGPKRFCHTVEIEDSSEKIEVRSKIGLDSEKLRRLEAKR